MRVQDELHAEAGGERGSQADETEHSFRRALNDDEDW